MGKEDGSNEEYTTTKLRLQQQQLQLLQSNKNIYSDQASTTSSIMGASNGLSSGIVAIFEQQRINDRAEAVVRESLVLPQGTPLHNGEIAGLQEARRLLKEVAEERKEKKNQQDQKSMEQKDSQDSQVSNNSNNSKEYNASQEENQNRQEMEQKRKWDIVMAAPSSNQHQQQQQQQQPRDTKE